MNVVVTLAPDFTAKKIQVGDLVKLQIFADAKVGNAGDGWEITGQNSAGWISAGSFTVNAANVRVLPTDSNATKLEIEALVHQPGPLTLGDLVLLDQVTKEELAVPASNISGSQAETIASTEIPPNAPWMLGSVPFGGWDWSLLSVLGLVILAILAITGRLIWQRVRAHLTKNLTNLERTLNAIQNLQRFSRSKTPLDLSEWKKFSFELAGILRRYSDENFRIDSSDMTDREFLNELGNHPKAAPELAHLSTILATITEVRYGRKALDSSLVPGLLLDARKFVENTVVKENEENKR